MENTFLHFNNEDTFQNQKSEIKNASVSFVKDSGKLYTHGEEYDSVNWGEIKLENGVYVYTNTGQLVKPEAWDTANNDNAVGVAVIDDNCRFVIGKTGRNNNITWSNTLMGTDVSGIMTTTDSSTAKTDYTGENNTALIRAVASGDNSSYNAAHWCYAQTITVNGTTKHGYLAAAGEWQAANGNKSAVDGALSKIGGAAMLTGRHWSSTEFSEYFAWLWSWSDNGLYYTNKEGVRHCAVPFFPLNL